MNVKYHKSGSDRKRENILVDRYCIKKELILKDEDYVL
jgi:hypothetical protein